MKNNRWLKPLKNHQKKPIAAAKPFTSHRRDKKKKVTEVISSYYFRN
jgi:hypothetical protein